MGNGKLYLTLQSHIVRFRMKYKKIYDKFENFFFAQK